MTAFVKFDPWAFLERERGEDKAETLAGLATLADLPLQNENPNTSLSENQKQRATPAKVAKVAKVGSPGAEPYPFAGALNDLERRCPEYIAPGRWRQCVEDATRFLATWGDKAIALGWTADELFGLYQPPAKPHASYCRLSRSDATGLLWNLQDRRVVAITENTAAVENARTGNVTVYRKRNKPAFGPMGDSLDDFIA